MDYDVMKMKVKFEFEKSEALQQLDEIKALANELVEKLGKMSVMIESTDLKPDKSNS